MRFNNNILQSVAITVAVVGAAVSLYFMFNAGRNQKSIVLILLFTGWVLSPFAGFFIAHKIYNRWIVQARASLYWLVIILTIASVIAYSGAFNTSKTKNAFVFLIVPLISWLLITITVLTARRLSPRTRNTESKKNDNV